MISKTIESYGGEYVDARPISNPQTQVSADKLNRALEDTAQMTRTCPRAMLHFITVTSGDPDVAYHTSVWGSGSEQWPTLSRTSTGRYTVTYPTSFTDALDYEETVSFLTGNGHIMDGTDSRLKITAISANVISLWVLDTTGTLSDLSGAATVVLWLR